jgi:hypothetical protein
VIKHVHDIAVPESMRRYRKTAINPRHYWLHGGSEQKNDPLRIWFYPQ